MAHCLRGSSVIGGRIIIHAGNPEGLAKIVRDRHPQLQLSTCDSYEALPGLLEKLRPEVVFTIRFAGTPGFPREALLGAHGPRWISVGGSGCDHLGRWNPAEVTVTNSAGVAAGMMAEYVIGSILHFSLDLAELEKDRRNEHWSNRIMQPVNGRTILIIGLGKTGQAVARLAKALGMRTVGTRAHPAPTEHVDEVHSQTELPVLADQADYLVVCAPLLPSTRGLLDADFFSRTRPGLVVVDVSRGGIIDEGALLEALRNNHLKGAALDVFATEPLPKGHQLWKMENVIISPHCSSVYDGWEEASINMFCDNLANWRQGKPLFNVVDPLRGY